MQTIADRIELMLAERRLKRADLARKAGMAKSTLQSVMDTPNRSPRAQTIQKLADALGVDHTWLATGKHSKGKDLGEAEPAKTGMDANRIARIIEEQSLKLKVPLGPADRAKLIAAVLDEIESV